MSTSIIMPDAYSVTNVARNLLTKPMILIDASGVKTMVDFDGAILNTTIDATDIVTLQDVSTTGIKGSVSFKLSMPSMDLSADVVSDTVWRVDDSSSGGQGRINFDIKKNGASIGAVKATGLAESLKTTGDKRSVVMTTIPATSFAVGDTLEFVYEFEVTETGTGDVTVQIKHNADAAGDRTILQVNL